MTNAQIIFNASIELMENGIIKGTGRIFEYEDENGEKKHLEEPEPLHTYAKWQELGRQVRKGEKAKAGITIWKQGKSRNKRDKDGNEEEVQGNMFLKKAFFFTFDQTEPKA